MFLENLFIEPFQYEFMRNALMISILAGVVAPLTGYWALTRRMVYLTDAMSHSVLPGVIIASMLGVSILAKSAPDGHTLGIATAPAMAINPTLYKQIPFDVDKDFVPISLYVKSPFILVINPT